jgi:glycerol uptake facilitator-like aquaporin
MDPRLRACLVEMVGTWFVVFFGASAVCAQALTTWPPLDVAGLALAEGCTLAVVLTCTMPWSEGYLNPAITVALWVGKRIDSVRALMLIAAQLVGAVLAGFVVSRLFTDDILKQTLLGTPHFEPSLLGARGQVTLYAMVTGAGLEAVFACLLTLAVFASCIDRRAPRLGGVLVGLAQMAVIVVGARFTGGSGNPARWAGPAVWQASLPSLWQSSPLSDHAAYWAAPVVGAIVGAMLYRTLFLPTDQLEKKRS